MNRNILIVIAFVLVVLAQLYVPAKMIWDSASVIESGTLYHFRTTPVDPNAPFRGKYIILRYEDTNIKVDKPNEWFIDEIVYVSFKLDEEGFAQPNEVTEEPPLETEDYLEATVNYTNEANNTLWLNYSFTRFYMEESKAYDAELLYRASQRDTTKQTYATVSIKGGKAVIMDVMIDGVGIKELVEKHQQTKQ